MKEAAVQRRHNLYRDSIVLSNSDPSLHLLGEHPSIDWAREHGGAQEKVDGAGEDVEGDCESEDGESQKKRRVKQVVSMIQVEDFPVLPNESCIEVPGNGDIPETDEEEGEKDGDGENSDATASLDQKGFAGLSDGSVLKEEEAKAEEQVKEIPLEVESATENASALEEKDKGEDSQSVLEEQQPPPSSQEGSEKVLLPVPPPKEMPSGATEMAPESPAEVTADSFPPPPHDDSGFQSPTSEVAEAEEEMQVAPLPAEEHIEVKETSTAVAPEAEAKTIDSGTRETSD